jgi:predicted MFS family arabinose efflux permease
MSAHSNDASPLATAQEPMRRSTVWLMATTVGVVVANIYYAQPLLADIAHSFGLTVTHAGAIAMLSQAGTATGMFLFVPLGDKFERRSLITLLMLGSFAALVLFAAAPNVLCLAVGQFRGGRFCGQRACRGSLCRPSRVGPNSAGAWSAPWWGNSFWNVLLARTFSGSIGALFGWRAVYGIAPWPCSCSRRSFKRGCQPVARPSSSPGRT